MGGREIYRPAQFLQREHFVYMIPHVFDGALNGIEGFRLAAVIEFIAETERIEVLPQAHVGIQQIVVAVSPFQVGIYLREQMNAFLIVLKKSLEAVLKLLHDQFHNGP